MSQKCDSSGESGVCAVGDSMSPYSPSLGFTTRDATAPALEEFDILLDQSTRTSIRVVWTDSSATSDYTHRVYYYDESVDVDAHEATIEGLTAGKRYSFSSSNIQDGVESDKSKELIVDMTPDYNPPNVPAGLQVSLTAPGVLQVSFRGNNTNMADIKGYTIYYGVEPAHYSHKDITADRTQDSISQSIAVQEDTNYYFTVSAYDMERPQSNESEKAPMVFYQGEEPSGHTDHDKKGCFIATAAFGSPDHPMVKIFRDFRDKILLDYPLGKRLVAYYYQHSPKASETIRNSYVLKLLAIALLSPALLFCYSALQIGILWTSTLSVFLISSIVVWKCLSPKE